MTDAICARLQKAEKERARNRYADVILVGAYRYDATQMCLPRNVGRKGVTAAQRRYAALDRFYRQVDYAGWLGRKPTHAERMALLRCLVRLEEDGFLIRLKGRGGNRTTHVYLTERGEAEALRILTNAVDLLPIDAPWNEDDPVPAP